MQYRRTLIEGGTYFFTVNLANRRTRLLTAHIGSLRQAVREVRRNHPFNIVAWVVLPEHLHTIWTLPRGDDRYSVRWNQIKGAFSRNLPTDERIAPSRLKKRERGIWQRRFWEHCVRDEDDLRRHVDYIHYNPVKHGHVQRVVDWPYSTFHRFVRRGWLPMDWGCDGDFPGNFGER